MQHAGGHPLALCIQQVSFAYGAHRALDGVSFDIESGEFAALLGPNGAGKTTLVSLICRLIGAQEGVIEIEGRRLSLEGHRALEPLGIVFQDRSLDPELTVEQNLRHAAALRGIPRREAAARIEMELDRAGLGERRRTAVSALNGGHRRRVEIARAFLHRPRLLVCDEATTGLDIPARRALIAHVRRLVQEEAVSVLWATHLAEEVEPSDRLIVLNKGRIAMNEIAAVATARTGNVEATFTAVVDGEGR